MQMLFSQTSPDPDAWREAFDADAEDRSNAGLTLLQLWRDADEPGTHWALFEVSDRGRAQGWLDSHAQLDAHRVEASATTSRFVETA